jgi:hypothetical protein
MQNFFSIFVLGILTGCASLKTLNQSPLATSQSPATKSEDCSGQSKIALEKKDVKPILFRSQSVTESGQLRTGQQVGYSFDAQAGQQFNFRTPDPICVQLYTPSNQLLKGRDLPKDGKYIVQVSVPQGSTSFKLEMSLESTLPSQASPNFESFVKKSTNNPTQQAKASPSAIPSSPNPSLNPSPTYININGQALDNMADKIFYEKHPELRGEKIGDEDTKLSLEWKQIRECDAIVDYIFYQRYPGLNGRKIESSETDLRTEWFNIRNGVSGCS